MIWSLSGCSNGVQRIEIGGGRDTEDIATWIQPEGVSTIGAHVSDDLFGDRLKREECAEARDGPNWSKGFVGHIEYVF